MANTIDLAGCVSGLQATRFGKYESDKDGFSHLAFFSARLSLAVSLLILLRKVLVLRVVSHDASSYSSPRKPCAGSAAKG
jgi:hypothetical protein